MQLRNAFSIIAILGLTFAGGAVQAQTRIDVGANTDRGDTRARHWIEWSVPNGPSAARPVGAVTLTLSAEGAGGSTLQGELSKAGLEHGAKMATDGVIVGGGPLNLAIAGLTAGHHTIVTYHNSFSRQPLGKLDILLDGRPVISGLQPSHLAPNDAFAASAFIPVEVQAGQTVKLSIRPADSAQGGGVILNGIEIDAVDPTKKAVLPLPADDDEHANGDLGRTLLTWTPARGAIAHEVYLSDDPRIMNAANRQSPAFQGKQSGASFEARGLDTSRDYFWRVDEVDAAGNVTQGDVWRFRLRHLAFPTAEGYGRFARGGRYGRVIEVTTLNDGGPGSLREALAEVGPRTIVFRVGGTIVLNGRLGIGSPYVTVAGQTAPGEGICLQHYGFGVGGTHDVIIRNMRVRIGDISGMTQDGSGAGSSDHVIWDHCSVSWSIDEGFSSRGAHNITLQRSIISEALNMSIHGAYVGTGKGHSFAGSISGDIGSFHHNLLVNCAGRNWSLAGGYDQTVHYAGYLDLRNNVCFNWVHRTSDGGVKMANLVNNYYKPGPATRMFDFLKFDGGKPEDPQYYFVSGNVMEGRFDANDKGQGVVLPPEFSRNIFRADAPVFPSFIKTQSAQDAYVSVLADVGCNRPKQDAMDTRLINEVRTGKPTYKGSKTGFPGIVDSQEDSGGYPSYPEAHHPADFDTDHDGMPGAWEKAHGLNPADPADGNADSDGDGYTNLEDYLNFMAGDLDANLAAR